MKKIIFSFSTIILSVGFSFSQDFANYTPVKCSGNVPEDFRQLTSQKFKQDVKEEAKNSKSHYVNYSKEQFLLHNNYILNELLLSGVVLFNDPVTEYINKVADTLLNAEPELRKNLRFYCIRSSESNAFSTKQGIVFVTYGLMAQLENESQLAYILCHEIAHYEKKHVINSYLEGEKIYSRKGEYKYSSFSERLRLLGAHSRDLEFEADSLAFIRFMKTKYKVGGMVTAFDVLQYSYLPFEEMAFKPDFLATAAMQFPKAFLLDTIKEINYLSDDVDDSNSTHPNVKKRRQKIEMMIEKYNLKGEKYFILSKEKFIAARDIARFETVRLDLKDRKYCDAVYNAMVLMKKYPSNKYLECAMGKALYGVAKYKNEDRHSDVADYYGGLEGNLQQCYYFFYQISSEQLNTVTCRYLFNLKQKYNDSFMNKLTDDAFIELSMKHNLNYADFYLAYSNAKAKEEEAKKPEIQKGDSIKKDSVIAGEEDAEFESKYDKIRKQKKEWEEKQKTVEPATPSESLFNLSAFADIINDAELKKQFEFSENEVKSIKSKKEAEDKKNKTLSDYERRKKENDEMKSYKRLALGVNKMIIIDPFYFSADDRGGLKILDSEQKLVEFNGQIKKCSEKAGLEAQVISSKSFTDVDVELYNDMSLMNSWVTEKMDHDHVTMIPLESDFVNGLVQKYGTKYFCFTGLLSYKDHREGAVGIILAGIVLYPLFPIALYMAATPINRTYYYTLLYDVEKGEAVMTRNVKLNAKSNKGYVNSIMYDLMVQIKKEKKVK